MSESMLLERRVYEVSQYQNTGAIVVAIKKRVREKVCSGIRRQSMSISDGIPNQSNV